MADRTGRGPAGLGEQLAGRLGEAAQNLISAAGERLLAAATDKLGSTTQRLTEYAEGSGTPGGAATGAAVRRLVAGQSPGKAMFGAAMAGGKEKLMQVFGKGGKGGKGGGKGGKLKVTNIVETIDVGVPVRVAYNQWTQFEEFPTFMKKVENVRREDEDKLVWKAQVFWSHRSWKSTVVEQVPDERIVWRSEGEKGYVDGAVSFHAVTPNLTRIVLVLEYNPQGLFEKTGNIWRAQGRRARLELKHFVRHVMTRSILHPDELEGWRGEIRDGELVRDHETALEDERRERQEREADERQERESDERYRAAEEGPDRYDDEYDDYTDEEDYADEDDYDNEDDEEDADAAEAEQRAYRPGPKRPASRGR